MARIDDIENRLRNWARWKDGASGGRLNYSSVKWGAPMPKGPRDTYDSVPVPINDIEASETDQAVQRLPSELKATVIECYTGRGGEAEHLRVLCCAKATMYARIDRAHRLLADHFAAKQDRQREERERLERLQRQAKQLLKAEHLPSISTKTKGCA